MSGYQRLIVIFLVAPVPLACSATHDGQPGGARPEFIFEDIGGA